MELRKELGKLNIYPGPTGDSSAGQRTLRKTVFIVTTDTILNCLLRVLRFLF